MMWFLQSRISWGSFPMCLNWKTRRYVFINFYYLKLLIFLVIYFESFLTMMPINWPWVSNNIYYWRLLKRKNCLNIDWFWLFWREKNCLNIDWFWLICIIGTVYFVFVCLTNVMPSNIFFSWSKTLDEVLHLCNSFVIKGDLLISRRII